MAFGKVTRCRVRGADRFKFEFRDPHGERRTRFFTTAGDAQVYSARMEREAGLKSALAAEVGRTFGAYARYWLEKDAADYAHKSVWNYRNSLLNHILPCVLKIGRKYQRIETLALREIGWPHAEAFLRAKTEGRIADGEEPYKRNSLIGFLTAWSACLSGAVEAKLLSQNPLHGKRPKIVQRMLAERREPTFLQRSLSPELAETFLCRAQAHPHFVAMLLMLDGGLRIGEVCGLQIADASLGEGLMHIQRQRTQEGGLKLPKWDHTRMVELTDRLRRVLADVARRQAGPWVCADRKGQPLSQGRVARATNAVLRDVGLATYTPHSLRHTFGRLHAISGCSMKWLQEQMGHRSIHTTMRYTEGLQFRDPDAGMRLERLVPGGRANSDANSDGANSPND